MSRRKKIEDSAEVKYGHILQVMTDWIDTTVFVAVCGRGTAKSTVVLARRSWHCIMDMPGGAFAFVANTYANLENNVMPAVQKGWQLMGLIEGIHYVKGERPPESWRRKCSVIVDDWSNTYSFWNGCVIFLGSLNNPSLLAGKSVLHIFYDEAKYAKDEKVNRAMPILRGDALTFGRSHLFLGYTVTTDMPDVNEGEYDWFFRSADQMDPERIAAIVQVASMRNDALIRLTKAENRKNPAVSTLRKLQAEIEKYDGWLLKLRKGATFFINTSSFINVDILTLDYIKRLAAGTLETHEFNKSVVGMKPGVRRDLRFYVLFGEDLKYYNGTRSGEAAYSSRELTYLHHDQELDGGMDFGNMLSLVIAQTDGQYYRCHRNFYEIPPRWFRELADQFLAFFAQHENKVLNLYYDRAGNNFEKQKEDYATKIKDAIEKDAAGRRTGWIVNLKSKKQATIKQEAEYDFMQELMSGKNKQLPHLLVDAVNCREMVASVELARAEVQYRNNQKVVHKVKKSERLEPKKLPMHSTNFSDAFKYLMMRSQWVLAAKGKRAVSAAGAVDVFLKR